MTLIPSDARPPASPSLHALVIGVGAYTTLGTLKSPPASTSAMASWLLDRYTNPDAPLGTVELLVSGGGGSLRGTAVEAATTENVKQAFKRWYVRCHASEGNIAFFYFCGHGLARGQDRVLLTEGFDRAAPSPFDDALAFDAFANGMMMCNARKQVFVVDACREAPSWLLAYPRLDGFPLVEANLDLAPATPRDWPVFYAAADGESAFGDADGPSVFTRALLRALDGPACDDRYGDTWEVRPEYVVPSVWALMQRDAPPGSDPPQRPQTGGESNTFRLHVPPKPVIPVRIGCAPPDLNAGASLSVSRDGQTVSQRPAGAAGDWDVDLEIAEYQARADLPAPSPPRVAPVMVRPPVREARLG